MSPARRPAILVWLLMAGSTLLLVVLLAAGLRQLWRQDLAALRETEDERAADLLRQLEETLRGVESNIAGELAGFHLEGLEAQLAQWAEGSEFVAGAFVWNPAEARLWTTADGLSAHLGTPSDWIWKTGNRPALRYALDPATAGATYLQDNLEILAYEGIARAPLIAWANSSAQPEAYWVCWHRLGPEYAVRGCVVRASPILRRLREVLANDPGGPVTLAPRHEKVGKSSLSRPRDPFLHTFPTNGSSLSLLHDFGLRMAPGEALALRRYHLALWAMVGGTVLLFLLGVALLVRQTRREALEARRRFAFVSQVSHELRTPLTSIRMFSEMLESPELDPGKRLRFAGTVRRESVRLAALIDRLLTFHRVEKDQRSAARERVEIGPLVDECLEIIGPKLDQAEFQVEREIEPELVAWTDSSALKQSLLNLFENALRYAAEGRLLRIEARTGEERIELRVGDAGPGIPRNLRSRIFEPFVQGRSELHDKHPGLGLGLSISRRLLQAGGGELVLDSTSAPGATFRIRLPRPPRS